ncbi:MAG TPA: hypothetical protein V6D19_18440 [Stenomitos sp.]
MTSASLPSKLILSKGEYKTCRIKVKDAQETFPAIALSQQFYSFFRVAKDRDKALNMLSKLFDNGHRAVITQTPKAYAIWVLETEAMPLG